MIHLVIPDIHDKIDAARRIIDSEPHHRRVFLGDFFDDFHTGTREAAKTAQFLREQLNDPDADVLLGNHDLSYGWGSSVRGFRCSGYSTPKWDAIREHLDWEDWKKFKLHLWIQSPDKPSGRPWLLTHAGFDQHFVRDEDDVVDVVDQKCATTLKSLHSPDASERGLGCSLLGAGPERGGSSPVGGLLWIDWQALLLPPGIDQLVGHTPALEPRVSDSLDAVGVCVDTHLRDYAILEDGMLDVRSS